MHDQDIINRSLCYGAANGADFVCMQLRQRASRTHMAEWRHVEPIKIVVVLETDDDLQAESLGRASNEGDCAIVVLYRCGVVQLWACTQEGVEGRITTDPELHI